MRARECGTVCARKCAGASLEPVTTRLPHGAADRRDEEWLARDAVVKDCRGRLRLVAHLLGNEAGLCPPVAGVLSPVAVEVTNAVRLPAVDAPTQACLHRHIGCPVRLWCHDAFVAEADKPARSWRRLLPRICRTHHGRCCLRSHGKRRHPKPHPSESDASPRSRCNNKQLNNNCNNNNNNNNNNYTQQQQQRFTPWAGCVTPRLWFEDSRSKTAPSSALQPFRGACSSVRPAPQALGEYSTCTLSEHSERTHSTCRRRYSSAGCGWLFDDLT